MLSGIASDGVDAEGPSSHVGEQGDQEGDADDLEDHGVAHHGLDGKNHAVVGVDGIGRHGGADAKAGEQVDHGDGQATDDDGLGDIASGIGHVVGHGADDLEAHEVKDDDRQVTESVGVGELGQEGGSGHVVRKTVLHGVPNAQSADDNGNSDLDDGAAVEDPLGVGRFGATHEVDDPHKGKIDTHLGDQIELDAKDHAQNVGEHGCQRGNPQRVVNPVVVRNAGAPLVAQAIAHPVVNAALAVIGGAELGDNHAIREQEGQDQEDPPEELLVANGSSRRGGLANEDDADDGRNDRQEGKLFLSVAHDELLRSVLDRSEAQGTKAIAQASVSGRQETSIRRPQTCF